MSIRDWPVELDPLWGCWLWTKDVDKRDGRAQMFRNGRPVVAYRSVYESEVGPIPDGLMLEHTCCEPRCCRPAHLEPVTASENQRRRTFGYRMRIKQCKRGHALEQHGMVTPKGGRTCRICSRGDEP